MILVRLSPLQRALYTEFMNRFREAGNTGWLSLNPLKAFCVCCKVRSASVCLDLFRNFVSLVTIMTFIYSFFLNINLRYSSDLEPSRCPVRGSAEGKPGKRPGFRP